jgi:GntR family transcriptional regulator, rspAB operon transcriptional repressor
MQRRKTSRADHVHDQLRHLIVTLELKPGQPLLEKDLCARFGVSRTPVREALLRLADNGLVTIAPQHGTFVAGISPKAVRMAHFLRENLEIPAMRRLVDLPRPDLGPAREVLVVQKIAATRNDQGEFILLDDRFHEALFDAAGLGDLWAVIHARKGHLDRIRFLQGNARGSVEVPLAQHEAILASLEARASDESASLLREHVAGSLVFMERLLPERPDLFLDDDLPARMPA